MLPFKIRVRVKARDRVRFRPYNGIIMLPKYKYNSTIENKQKDSGQLSVKG